jgi:hypothetical protein
MNIKKKSTRSSRWKCLCQTRLQMHDCGAYQPVDSASVCRHMDTADRTRCQYQEVAEKVC